MVCAPIAATARATPSETYPRIRRPPNPPHPIHSDPVLLAHFDTFRPGPTRSLPHRFAAGDRFGNVKIVIVQRGRIRDPLVTAARDEYVKRFRRFGSLEVVERETRDDESLFPKGRGYKVRLDETGVAMTSVEFARALERWA